MKSEFFFVVVFASAIIFVKGCPFKKYSKIIYYIFNRINVKNSVFFWSDVSIKICYQLCYPTARVFWGPSCFFRVNIIIVVSKISSNFDRIFVFLLTLTPAKV
jgi:hypothetical protein